MRSWILKPGPVVRHTIGRTGRAGANGMAISFCDHEEKAFAKDIQKLIGKSIPLVNDHPFLMKTVNRSNGFNRSVPTQNRGYRDRNRISQRA